MCKYFDTGRRKDLRVAVSSGLLITGIQTQYYSATDFQHNYMKLKLISLMKFLDKLNV